ncbi:TfoX/Sxy family protein [Mesorhizobium microcysteis]|uniref:TfoX/Sxy family protein n=1 Tax=Neoaquamicrobium microcysteis TaxID=2682781 RepID=A0A5D4GPY5_9HYPH|nr:TfoX/Sxy family protein [Mesorhizobium microcysteis]TYR30931.1 TfoX/Sxy family protein [Mesorhizobium microcysteis]
MDKEAIADLFAGLGRVTVKRMFGGKGIYHDGLIVALEVDGEILLKADAQSAPDFEAAGSRQWVYEGHMRKGPVAMPYWSIPDDALDDPDEVTVWARRAFEASLRAQSSKKSRKK